MQLHSHTAHTPHDLGGPTSVWGDGLWVVFSHRALGSSSRWLTWAMAPPLAMPALALHLAALSCSCFGWQYRHPKLAAAIDPAWPCHSCGLIIRLITPPLRFFASAYSLSILPIWVTTRFPSEVKSNFIKWGMSKDRPANLVWHVFFFFLTVIRKSGKLTEWMLVLSWCGGWAQHSAWARKWWGSKGLPLGLSAC